MARITLFPGTDCAQINGDLAQNVDFTGIDPTIHCVQWYDTVGSVEYVDNPITGVKPPNQTIDTIAPYASYVANAEAIIDAYTNPQVFYSTQDENLWNGVTYQLGNEILVTTIDTPPPANSTNTTPPTPAPYQQLYWYSNSWVRSPVNPSLSLADAKAECILLTQQSAAEQGDYQARLYSAYQLVSSPDPGALMTADYFGLDLEAYQTYLDAEVAANVAFVNGCTSVPQLYTFDWQIPGDPNA
jgi:hypothetical protein